MPQARGSQTTVAIFDETTFATNNGSPDGTKLYIVTNGVKPSQNLLDSQTLFANRSRTRPGRGNIDVGGPLNMEISAENIGKILKHALGQVATTGSGPYSHVITLGTLPASFGIEDDYGSNVAGAARYQLRNGLRVSDLTLTFPQEGFCTASFTLKGAKSTFASTPLDATLTDNGHTPFTNFQGAMLEGGSAVSVITDAQIRLNNDLDDGVFAYGGNGQRRALPEGFASVTGQFNALFEDATLINKAINDTASSFKVTLSRGDGLGSSGNESIEFHVTDLVYERTGPEISGPRGIIVPLSFRGYRSGSNNGLQATIKNAISAL